MLFTTVPNYVVQILPFNHLSVLWMWSTCQDVLWARWLEVWPPGCRGAVGPGNRVEGWGEGMWRRRWWWFTLEEKVNSSCCFKSLGKPRLQRELDRAPLSECEPEQRYFWARRAHTIRPMPPPPPSPPPRLWSPHSVQGFFRFQVIISFPYLYWSWRDVEQTISKKRKRQGP